LPIGIVALGARLLDARMRRLVRDASWVAAVAPIPEVSPSGIREIDAIREVLRVTIGRFWKEWRARRGCTRRKSC